MEIEDKIFVVVRTVVGLANVGVMTLVVHFNLDDRIYVQSSQLLTLNYRDHDLKRNWVFTMNPKILNSELTIL